MPLLCRCSFGPLSLEERTFTQNSEHPQRRPVSHPRSSNRTCPIKASGFPTGFTADSRTSFHLGAAELQYPQLAKHRFDTETVSAARWHLVTPPQEMPYALIN